MLTHLMSVVSFYTPPLKTLEDQRFSDISGVIKMAKRKIKHTVKNNSAEHMKASTCKKLKFTNLQFSQFSNVLRVLNQIQDRTTNCCIASVHCFCTLNHFSSEK